MSKKDKEIEELQEERDNLQEELDKEVHKYNLLLGKYNLLKDDFEFIKRLYAKEIIENKELKMEVEKMWDWEKERQRC